MKAEVIANNRTDFEHLWHLVGNTPMLRINYNYKGKAAFIFAKCEHYNLTGSIKDRMALSILQMAYQNGDLHPGERIVEATSGNTGISFSAIGRALGHRVTIIMPDWLSKERIDIIRSFGAEIKLVSKEEGGFRRSIQMAEELASANPSVFLPRQFENEWNVMAHRKSTAPEIGIQLDRINLKANAFVAGVGTGGTVMGIGGYLRQRDKTVRVHPLEPAESPTLSTGFKNGTHRIQGISDEFIPPIVKLGRLDKVVSVHDGDAILMAQKMANLGLAVGISSGANVLGAIKIREEIGSGAVVVTVLPDSNKKYLSTDLMKEETEKEEYLSPAITLNNFTGLERAFGG